MPVQPIILYRRIYPPNLSLLLSIRTYCRHDVTINTNGSLLFWKVLQKYNCQWSRCVFMSIKHCAWSIWLSAAMTNESRPNIVYSVCQCVVVLLSWWYVCFWLFNYYNRPISQIPQCIRQIPHNAPYCNRNVHTCAHFCYKMVHCGIWDCWIVGFVRWVYYPSTSEIILNGTGKADRVLTKAKQSRVQSLYIFLVFALVWLATKLLT